MASERLGVSSCFAARLSTVARNSADSRGWHYQFRATMATALETLLEGGAVMTILRLVGGSDVKPTAAPASAHDTLASRQTSFRDR
jgi:hypothetical protein